MEYQPTSYGLRAPNSSVSDVFTSQVGPCKPTTVQWRTETEMAMFVSL